LDLEMKLAIGFGVVLALYALVFIK
jgi:hypothetical protein